MFTFIHAADLHLDSPLVGLRQRASEHARRIEDASRSALDALVALAIQESAAFMVLAGDVFDGHWRDYRTGVFFAERMARLREAGIAVYVIRGNHDAENKFMQRLSLSDNVHMFTADAAETKLSEAHGVALHGQSYVRRDVTENLVNGYPEPRAGYLNLGILHTACTGRAGHATYAPCTVEQLAQRGYDYWALGHVHAHELLSSAPFVAFSGNLQGRSIRETGPKGALVVRAEGTRVLGVEHRALDSVRFSLLDVPAGEHTHVDDLLAALRVRMLDAIAEAGERALIARVVLSGESTLHDKLVAQGTAFQDEVTTLLAGLSSDAWLEKLSLRTARIVRPEGDPSVLGELGQAVSALAQGPHMDPMIERVIAELASKLPGELAPEALLARLRLELPQRARDLALALLEKGRG